MAYTAEGIDARAEVMVDAVDTVRFYLKRDGALIAPDALSVWVTILHPSGTTLVPRTQAGVTQAATGALTFTTTWSEPTFELSEDFVAVWEWQESGVTSTDRQFFDVVRTKLPCLIDTNDLQEFYPDIEKHLRAVGETDPKKFIRRAWSVMLDRIRSGGNRPSLILDRSRLVNPAIQLALEFCCGALVRQTGDLWETREKKHHKWWDTMFAGLGELKYDDDEDALTSDNEKKRINRRQWSV